MNSRLLSANALARFRDYDGLTACLALISYIWVDDDGFCFFISFCLSCKEEDSVRRYLSLPGELCFIESIVNDPSYFTIFAALTLNCAFQTGGFLNYVC